MQKRGDVKTMVKGLGLITSPLQNKGLIFIQLKNCIFIHLLNAICDVVMRSIAVRVMIHDLAGWLFPKREFYMAKTRQRIDLYSIEEFYIYLFS